MKKEKYHSVLQHLTIPSGLRITGQNVTITDNDPEDSSKLYPVQKKAEHFENDAPPPVSRSLSPTELQGWVLGQEDQNELQQMMRNRFLLEKVPEGFEHKLFPKVAEKIWWIFSAAMKSSLLNLYINLYIQ